MPIKLNTASGGGVILTGANTASDKTITVPAVDGTMQIIKLETSKASTSGTSVDFTDIPSWVKRITVMFSGVSTNGTSNPLIQIGAGSVTTSGYTSRSSFISSTTVGDATYTAGFGIFGGIASHAYSGHLVLTNITGNTWVCSSVLGTTAMWFSAGNVALSGTLDRVRITTVNGTDTFDAGTINLLLEG